MLCNLKTEYQCRKLISTIFKYSWLLYYLSFNFCSTPEEKHFFEIILGIDNIHICCSKFTDTQTHAPYTLRPWRHAWQIELTGARFAAVILLISSSHHGDLEQATDTQRWICLHWNNHLFQYLAEIRGRCLATPLISLLRAHQRCLTCPFQDVCVDVFDVCLHPKSCGRL